MTGGIKDWNASHVSGAEQSVRNEFYAALERPVRPEYEPQEPWTDEQIAELNRRWAARGSTFTRIPESR